MSGTAGENRLHHVRWSIMFYIIGFPCQLSGRGTQKQPSEQKHIIAIHENIITPIQGQDVHKNNPTNVNNLQYPDRCSQCFLV